MRLANRAGRALLVAAGHAVDLAEASGGSFGPGPVEALAAWDEVRAFAEGVDAASGAPLEEATLLPPAPRPSAVYAIGLNYRDHAAEAKLDVPRQPMVFTKFPSCLVGPRSEVRLFSERVDWEAELVVVIGREAEAVSEGAALDFVAGYCVGQDVSDRALQFSDRPPQFSLGKSRATFGPCGPAIVTLDELPDPLDLAIRCSLDDEVVQESRTSEMIFNVPQLVSYLSRHCRLLPGDLIFTGTPAGVGSVREPRRYLQAGETITTEIEGLGRLVNRCVAADSGPPGS